MRITGKMGAATAVTIGAAMVLAACGSGTVGGSSNGSGAPASNNKHLALVAGVDNEPFYYTMECGAKAEATKLGYTLDFKAPAKFDAGLQNPIITAEVNDKPAGALIVPDSDTASQAPMQQLKNAGTKVVEVDTSLKDTSVALSSISSNNTEGGKLAADTLGKLLNGKTGSVLALDTIAGTSTTDQRAQGFSDEIKAKYPNLKLLETEFTNNDPAVAATKVTAAIASTPDLVGIFATNLNTGQGAATGLGNAHKAGQIQLVGFDASPNEVTDLKGGQFQALIAQEPGTIGKDGVDQVVNAINGKPVTPNIPTDLVSITQANMDSNSQFFYTQTKC
ncbi:MAG TPA: ABC transporter substrate-binding protein [Pseudonocardiaceae bacterium]